MRREYENLEKQIKPKTTKKHRNLLKINHFYVSKSLCVCYSIKASTQEEEEEEKKNLNIAHDTNIRSTFYCIQQMCSTDLFEDVCV